MAMPKCTLSLAWNREDVFTGSGTVTTCYDVAMAFLEGQFAGPDHKAFMASVRASRYLDGLLNGNPMNVVWKDETGEARARVWPL